MIVPTKLPYREDAKLSPARAWRVFSLPLGDSAQTERNKLGLGALSPMKDKDQNRKKKMWGREAVGTMQGT